MKSKMIGRAGQGGFGHEQGTEGRVGAKALGHACFRKILVPIDFSESSMHALSVALDIAGHFGSVVVLLHVVAPTVYPDTPFSLSPALDETTQNLVESGRERLEVICRRRVGGQITAETLVRIGHAHSEIADTANALGVDLIVLSTRGHTSLQHVSLGSTAEKVLRQASCAVLTVKPPGST
jgi:nucleotide-binding universal stress UspA family protein